MTMQLGMRFTTMKMMKMKPKTRSKLFSFEAIGLSQRLVQNDRDGISKIQTPHFGIQHWYRYAILPVAFQQIVRQPARLPAKYETVG